MSVGLSTITVNPSVAFWSARVRSAGLVADLTLTLQKAIEGFSVIVDRPTDNNLIEIRQLLVPVLMKTKYDELTLTHNLSGVILLSKRYEQIYKKGAYVIPPVIALYDETIKKDATRLEINCAEGKHEARKNDRQLYETAVSNLLIMLPPRLRCSST